MLYKSGTYTGDGNDNRDISGVGFEPDCVMIWANSSGSKVWRSNVGFAGDQTTTFGTTTSTFANGIQSLDADGFQIGTNAVVNANGTTYYWAAFQDDGGTDFAVGTYTGNGVDDRNITVGFAPKFMFVNRISGTGTMTEFRIDTLATDEAWTAGGNTFNANTIQTEGATTFQVGTSNQVNTDTATYVWVAFGFGTTATYVGDGADNRSITGSGFDPTFVTLIEDGPSYGRAKVDGIPDETTLKYKSEALAATNEIQAFVTDGFQVGSDTDTNENTKTYHYFTTKTNPSAAGTNLQLNIGDAWKTVDGVQINIGDAWKAVAGMQINIDDAWKTIF